MASVDSREAAPQQKYVDFDEYVDFQLAKTRANIKWTEIWLTGGLLVTAALSFVLLFVVADQWIVPGGFSSTARTVCLSILLSSAAGILAWKVVVPSFRRVHQLFAARTIESSDPQLKSSLLNLVDLRSAGRQIPAHVLRAMEKRAAVELARVDVDQAVDRRPLLRVAYTLLGVVVLCCAYVLFSPKDALSSVKRLVLPTAAAPVATQTRIENVSPEDDRILARTLLTVEADILGKQPEHVTLLYTTADHKFADQPIEMRRVEEGLPRFRGIIPGENGRGILQNLTYYIQAGDTRSREYSIEVVQPPSAKVVRVDYDFPAYMRLSPRTQENGHIDAWEGAKVAVRAQTNMPVATAVLVLTDTEDPHERGEEIRMQVRDGTELTADWRLGFRQDGTSPHFYHIQCTTAAGETDPDPTQYTLKIQPDQRPLVELVHPVQDLERPANAVVPLLIRAADPDFQLRFLTLRVEKAGEAIEVPQAQIVSEERPSYEGTFDFKLADVGSGLKAGDEIQFWIEARDNKQPLGNRTNSSRLKITITPPVAPEEAKEQHEADKQEQQAQVEKQQQEQAEAEQKTSENGEQPEQQPGAEQQPMPKPNGSDRSETDPQQPSESPDPKSPPEQNQEPRKSQSKPGDQGQPGKNGKSGEKKPAEGGTEEGEEGAESKSGPPESKPSGNVDKKASEQEALQKLIRKQRAEQPKPGASKAGEPQPGEPKTGDKPDGKKPDQDSKSDSPEADDPDPGEPKPGEPKVKAPDDKRGKSDPKSDKAESKPNKSNPDKPTPDNRGADEPNTDEPNTDEPNTDEPNTDQPPPDTPTEDSAQDDSTSGEPKARPQNRKPEKNKKVGTQASEEKSGTGKTDESPIPDGSDANPDEADSESDSESDSNSKPKSDGASDPKPGEKSKSSPSKGDKGPQASGKKPAKDDSESQPGEGTDPTQDMPKDAKQSDNDGEAEQDPGDRPPTGAKPNKNKPAPDGAKEQPAEESPDAEKRQADGTEKGEGTPEQNPDGTEPQAQNPNDVKRKPGTKPAPDSKSAKPAPNQDPKSDATDGTASEKPDNVRSRPQQEPQEQDPSRRGKTGDEKTSNPRQKRPGDSPTRQEELKGDGRPDQKSQSPEDGEGGGSTPQDEGDEGSDEKGPGDASSELGDAGKPDREGQAPSGKPGEGKSTEPREGAKPQKSSAKGDGSKPGKPATEKSGEGQAGGTPNPEPGTPADEGNGSGAGSDAQPPSDAPRNGRRGGQEAGPPNQGSGEADATEQADAANLEYAREASNLVLKRLQDELQRGEVDQKMLDELGWTKEDLTRFARRLENQLGDKEHAESPEALARRRQFEAMLQSLNLQNDTKVRDGAGRKGATRGGVNMQRLPVPAEYRERYDAYTRGLSKRPAERMP